jgi:hypothetical protein
MRRTLDAGGGARTSESAVWGGTRNTSNMERRKPGI